MTVIITIGIRQEAAPSRERAQRKLSSLSPDQPLSVKAITSWAVSLSLGLPLPPDQSNACTEYAASAAWLRTVKTTSTSSSSQFLHPTGFAWGKIKTKRPGQEEGREAWGQAAYSVQAFDWTGGKGRPKERDTVRLVNALLML